MINTCTIIRHWEKEKSKFMPNSYVVCQLSEQIERIVFVPVIHIDTESVSDARKIVLDVKPDVVAVELDRTRYQQLINPQSVEPETSAPAGNSITDLMNQIAFLERNLGELTGAMAGDEMLAAIEAGRELGCKIALVDRPIEVTAQALMQIPLSEIYKLSDMIPNATVDVEVDDTVDLMEMLRDSENVENLMDEFRKEFPMLSQALIDQRDEYIATALKSILKDVEGKIVAVLGAGHIEGVKKALQVIIDKDSAS